MEGDVLVKIHEPNLCIVHQVCILCLEYDTNLVFCHACGIRRHVFRNEPVKRFVELALLPRKKFVKTIFIAHNSQGFDSQFVLKYMVEKMYLKPRLILNGTKIILLSIEKVKLIDSLNYFHMPLSALPKAFGLPDLIKGDFPHLFNTPENQKYSGPLPDIRYYSVDRMSCEKREKFLVWYEELKNSGYILNFQNDIEMYCENDVNILKLACLKFRKSFLEIGGVFSCIEKIFSNQIP